MEKDEGGMFLVALCCLGLANVESWLSHGRLYGSIRDFPSRPFRQPHQLPWSEMMHCVSMATSTPLILSFGRGPLYREPFVKRPTRLPGSSPHLFPRIHVYLTLRQRGCSYFQDVAVYFVTSDSVLSQPLPWNSSALSHTQSNDHPLPRDKYQML